MKRLLIFCICLFILSTTGAQTTVDYDLTAETAVGTGDFTAYQLSTNRYHVLATRPNSAYMRGAIQVKHQLAEDWQYLVLWMP